MDATPPHSFESSEQETDVGSSGPTRGANEAPEPTCEAVLRVEEGKMATSFYLT